MTPITTKNVINHELIGLEVGFAKNSCHNRRLVFGKVVDESYNTLVVKLGETNKRIAKKDTIFTFKLPEGPVEVEGSILVGRPEDRIKKRNTRRW